MKASEIAQQLKTIDRKIKENQIDSALELLGKIVTTEVPRECRVEMASLSRRLRVPEMGMRLLYPVVRPSRPLRVPATLFEKAEYGALLYRMGALEEALKILRDLDSQKHPSVDLYRAFAYQTKWDYESAIPLQEAFLKKVSPDDYLSFIARVNLVASYLFCDRLDAAVELLEKLRIETKRQGYALLHMNCLELSAQAAIQQRHFVDAEEFLEHAGEYVGLQPFLDAFFVEKWSAILKMARTDRAIPKDEWRGLRRKAGELHHWESVRDLDLYYALFSRDLNLLRRVYFGTPFPAYARRLERFAQQKLGVSIVADELFDFSLGPENQTAVSLDLAFGKNSTSKIVLKPNQVPHRLLTALTQDLYRPQRLAELHSFVFPNDYFSPDSSPGRMHQSIFRLKDFFAEAKLPLFIDEERGFFSLAALPDSHVRVSGKRWPSVKEIPQSHPRILEVFEKVPSRLRQRSFKAAEFAQALKLPKRTAVRYLSEAVSVQVVERRGRGLHTEYVFSDSRQKT